MFQVINSGARIGLLTLLAGGALAAPAAAQLRVVAWNISNWDGADRQAAVQTAVYGVFSGRSMSPDVVLLQECLTGTAMNNFRDTLNSAPGSPGDWVAAPFVDGADTESVTFYRSSKVSLVGGVKIVGVGSSSTTNQPRNTYRYDLRPVGYLNDSAVISMYNIHMKAGDASGDNTRRLVESQRIRDNAEGLPTGTDSGKPAAYQFLVGGDMNMQNSSQTSYVEYIGSQTNNVGRFFDPIRTPGSWNGNSSFRFVHTQDPSGAGGMDDRHDQILVGSGLIDGVGVDYIGNQAIAYSTSTWNDPNHSYRVWGNDGSSFDTSLTTTGNAMVGPAIAQALRDCADGGGHLPVFLDLRMPGKIGAPASIAFGTVAQGSTAQINVSIGNNGDVSKWTVAGLGNITYSLSPSAGFAAPGGSFNDNPGGSLNSHVVTMNTSTPGVKNGTLTITSNDIDTPTLIIPITGTVEAANLPPVANAGGDFAVTDTDGNGTEVVIANGSLSSDSDGNIILYRWSLGPTTLASGTNSSSNITLPVGVNDVLLTVTDNDNATATDTVRITVNPRPNTPPTADAGADITVNDSDGNGTQLVTLNGSLSGDSDGAIVSYTWREGVTVVATGQSPNVTFPVGSRTLELTVTDDDGAIDTDTVVVNVTPRVNTPPVADAGQDQALTDSDRSGDESVQLSGVGSNDDGSIVSYVWMIGNDPLATGVSPVVVLPVGSTEVTLTVTDNDGAQTSDTVIIQIDTPCVADFNQDGGVDGGDVEAFFEQWSIGNSAADVNADGGVDGGDVEEFFARWAEGAC